MTTASPIDAVLARFENVQQEHEGQWNARCPGHDDQKNSLAISGANDGKVLVSCHAGCDTGDLLQAVGLKLKDLFPPKASGKGKSQGRIAACYDYCDENGALLYQAVRFDPKGFAQRTQKDDGEWEWKLNGAPRVLFRLRELRAADPGTIVFIPEGEKDVENVRALGLVATTNVGGAGKGKWREEYSDELAGCLCVILPDNDEPGREHAQRVAKSLHGKAASVKILELVGLPDKGDVSDWLAAGGTKDELVKLATDAPEWKPNEDSGSPRTEAHGSPVGDGEFIDVGCKNLPIITAQAWDAISRANEPPFIFRSAGEPARIENDDHGQPIVKHLDEDRMRHVLARVAEWRTEKRRGENTVIEDAAPPMDVVRDVLATPDKPLPVLRRIVEAPVFAADGTIQVFPGYHRASETYYSPAPGFVVPNVPDNPDSSDIEAARTILIDELLGDFPFVGDAELAHAVALLILPFARDLIDGATPLHLFEKPSPGTGATLLVDALAFPATGRPINCMTEGRDEDEWRKRITAKLRGVATFILIDNLRRRLDSAAVSSAITSPAWEDRILGASEMVRIPVTSAWLATGNNPALSSEISRRTIRSRMDAKTDRPWLRDGFRHPNLREWMRENRGLLVWSVLTLIRAWIVAGRPLTSRKLGMFESWSHTIGGILQIGGIPGFLENLDSFYDESDAEGTQWRSFVVAWWLTYGEKQVKVAELWGPVCSEAGIELGDGSEQSQKVKLGKLLSAQRDRTYDVEVNGLQLRLRIERGDQVQRAFTWKLLNTEK